MKKYTKGFTLIELLVVIAIIGILSSVVLVSLNTARSKGNDAKTTAQLSSARASAEIFYSSVTPNSYNGSAGNVASDCTTANSMFTDSASGMSTYTSTTNYPSGTNVRCSSTGSAYQITASLSTATEFWCVNSAGISKKITAADHATAHPANDVDCTP